MRRLVFLDKAISLFPDRRVGFSGFPLQSGQAAFGQIASQCSRARMAASDEADPSQLRLSPPFSLSRRGKTHVLADLLSSTARVVPDSGVCATIASSEASSQPLR